MKKKDYVMEKDQERDRNGARERERESVRKRNERND